MYDGNRSLTPEEVRRTLARAEAAIHAAQSAQDSAARIVRRAYEIHRRSTRQRSVRTGRTRRTGS